MRSAVGAGEALFELAARSDQVVNPSDQLAGVAGLGEVSVGAAGEARQFVVKSRAGGEQDHRDPVQLRILLEGLTQGKAVHFRHHHVGDHQVGEQVAGGGETRDAVGGFFDAVSRFQVPADEHPDVRLVIDHQDGGLVSSGTCRRSGLRAVGLGNWAIRRQRQGGQAHSGWGWLGVADQIGFGLESRGVEELLDECLQALSVAPRWSTSSIFLVSLLFV